MGTKTASVAMLARKMAGAEAQPFVGMLKLVGAHFAQLVCDETADLFDGRDVTLERSLVPQGAKHLDRISFTVARDRFGLPQALTATIATKSEPASHEYTVGCQLELALETCGVMPDDMDNDVVVLASVGAKSSQVQFF